MKRGYRLISSGGKQTALETSVVRNPAISPEAKAVYGLVCVQLQNDLPYAAADLVPYLGVPEAQAEALLAELREHGVLK